MCQNACFQIQAPREDVRQQLNGKLIDRMHVRAVLVRGGIEGNESAPMLRRGREGRDEQRLAQVLRRRWIRPGILEPRRILRDRCVLPSHLSPSCEWYTDGGNTYGISPFPPIDGVLERCWPRWRRTCLPPDGGISARVGMVRPVGWIRHSCWCVWRVKKMELLRRPTNPYTRLLEELHRTGVGENNKHGVRRGISGSEAKLP